MAGAIASLLEDFSPTVGGETLGLGILRAVKNTAQPDPISAPAPSQPPVDRQAELIKSVETRVRAEEREAAQIRLEESIAAERARYEDELKAQRVIWVEQHAEQLSIQLVESIGRMETMISERVSNILKPFVSEAFRQQSMIEFKEVLATLLLGDEPGPIRIVGPEDLIQTLRANLGSHGGAVEFLPGDHVEVSVTARDTSVQTQLGPWACRLEKALKAES